MRHRWKQTEMVLQQEVSLNIYSEDPDKGENKFGEDLESSGVVVDLYLIARAVKTPGYDAYHYETMPGYDLDISGLTAGNDGENQTRSEERRVGKECAA